MENDKTKQRDNENSQATNPGTKGAGESAETGGSNFEQQRGIYKNSDGLGVAGHEPEKKAEVEKD